MSFHLFGGIQRVWTKPGVEASGRTGHPSNPDLVLAIPCNAGNAETSPGLPAISSWKKVYVCQKHVEIQSKAKDRRPSLKKPDARKTFDKCPPPRTHVVFGFWKQTSIQELQNKIAKWQLRDRCSLCCCALWHTPQWSNAFQETGTSGAWQWNRGEGVKLKKFGGVKRIKNVHTFVSNHPCMIQQEMGLSGFMIYGYLWQYCVFVNKGSWGFQILRQP